VFCIFVTWGIDNGDEGGRGEGPVQLSESLKEEGGGEKTGLAFFKLQR